MLLPSTRLPSRCLSGSRGSISQSPAPPQSQDVAHSLPFCCSASWRLVSISCRVAAKLRGRLPTGLGGH